MAIQWRIQDLQISGGGGHKNIFSALRASVWAKYKGGPKDAIEPHTTYT